MILLLRDTRPLPNGEDISGDRFLCVRVPSFPPDQDPYLGFSSLQCAHQFCAFHHISSADYEVVALGRIVATSRSRIALFSSERWLNEYFKNPSTFPYEKIIVPVLRGYAAYIPALLLRSFASNA
jgi:hypothetical protein